MRFAVAIVAAILAGFAIPALASVQPPEVGIRKINDLPMPLPYPYDKNANARADIDAAFARAKQSGKRVLIELGGNWCADCRILAAIMRLPEVKTFIEQHYETVDLDIGYYDRNMEIPIRYGIHHPAAPTIIIADPNGNVVNVSDATELSETRHMSPQGIADWLARWAEPVVPERASP